MMNFKGATGCMLVAMQELALTYFSVKNNPS